MLKRLIDISISSLLIIVLSPLLLLIALGVYFSVGRPILFTQARAGRYGRPFCIHKFRTMIELSDSKGNPLPDALRLTKFGSFLRSTSLDELPELWNVFWGDMSLVGPRPLLLEYRELYNDVQRRRHEVLPGITGLAQVSGRNELSWERRFELDVQYVDTQSIGLDLLILLKTIVVVLTRRGVTENGNATMSRFLGSGCEIENQARETRQANRPDRSE